MLKYRHPIKEQKACQYPLTFCLAYSVHFHASEPYYPCEFTFTYSFVFRAFRRSRTGADNANSAAISRSYK